MRWLLPLLCCVAFGSPATGGVIEVPVPGLQGSYSSISKDATVHLPAIPSVVHGVTVRVKGTSAFASYSCDGGPAGPQPVSVNATLYDGADFSHATSYSIADRYLDAPGTFEYSQPLYLIPDGISSFASLLDGNAKLNLSAWGQSPMLECHLVGPPDETTIDEITLLIDGEFATPADQTSWGAIKAIYR